MRFGKLDFGFPCPFYKFILTGNKKAAAAKISGNFPNKDWISGKFSRILDIFWNISPFSFISEPPARPRRPPGPTPQCRRRKLQRRARLPRPLNASAGGPPQRPEWLPVSDTSRSVTGPRHLPRGDSCGHRDRSSCGHSAAAVSLWSTSKSHLRP